MAEVTISLSKALQLKNRLAGRLTKVTGDINGYNSILKEKAEQVNVEQLLLTRDKLKAAIVNVKLAIFKGNINIQETLYLLEESKGDISFYQSLNTKHGSERHAYQNTEVTYVAYLNKEDTDETVKGLEATVDALQEKVNEYNYTTKISVPQEALDLASQLLHNKQKGDLFTMPEVKN